MKRVRARSVGNIVFGDISVVVDPRVINLSEVSRETSRRISERPRRDVDSTVEVVPIDEEIGDAVERISSGVEGVIEVHEIRVSSSGEGKRFLYTQLSTQT